MQWNTFHAPHLLLLLVCLSALVYAAEPKPSDQNLAPAPLLTRVIRVDEPAGDHHQADRADRGRISRRTANCT